MIIRFTFQIRSDEGKSVLIFKKSNCSTVQFVFSCSTDGHRLLYFGISVKKIVVVVATVAAATAHTTEEMNKNKNNNYYVTQV